jgi:muconolactone D-isomerase
MEFLVEIETRLPPDMPERERLSLLERERQRGDDLRRDGTIFRIWRLPGRMANVGVWRAADATELHAAIVSLPLHPWQEVSVRALAQHPLEESGS